MINFSDIKVDDDIKVLVKDDEGVEEDYYARVTDCLPTTFMVQYYTPTSMVYKGACLYELEEEEYPILQESIMEHYIEDTSPLIVKGDMFYVEEEANSNCSDSEVEDLSDDDELDDFIVPDEPPVLPPDHREVDTHWNNWVPFTPGAKKFKDTIDNIEQRVRFQNF